MGEKPRFDRVWEEVDNMKELEGILEKQNNALEELANKVVNLANQLDRHMSEADAHNPGTMHKK